MNTNAVQVDPVDHPQEGSRATGEGSPVRGVPPLLVSIDELIGGSWVRLCLVSDEAEARERLAEIEAAPPFSVKPDEEGGAILPRYRFRPVRPFNPAHVDPWEDG